jgi:hypothetical protein
VNENFMDPITAPTIPASYINFAKALGALADSHGIKAAQIKITPDWKDDARHINGDVLINYSSKDGRGRPCVNLDIYLNTHTTLAVVDNPPSSN